MLAALRAAGRSIPAGDGARGGATAVDSAGTRGCEGMGSPETLEFPALVAPVAGESPSGSDLRSAQGTPGAAKYSQLALLRKQATSFERDGGGDALAQAGAAWRTIRSLAVELLAGHTKDMQLCAWLIESQVRLGGFAGLRDGLRLARELVDGFWDSLHPRPEPGEPDSARIEPLCGLNGIDSQGTLIAPIGLVPLTVDAGEGAFSAYHWVQANAPYRGDPSRDSDFAEKQAQREAANEESRKKIRAAVAAGGADHYVALRDDLQGALQELAALDAAVTARCGGDALPTSSISKALAEALDAVLFLARDLLPAEPDPAAAAEGVGADAAGGGEAPRHASANGAISSRADAIATLKRVAEFYRAAEPHSPLSYMVEQVIRWGAMPLPDLLTELIPDASAREALFLRTGIQSPAR